MRSTLRVLHVAAPAVTANHGWRTGGVTFPARPAPRCRRVLLAAHTAFRPIAGTSTGAVKVVVYLRRRQPQARVAEPAARTATACGTGNAGTVAVTLSGTDDDQVELG